MARTLQRRNARNSGSRSPVQIQKKINKDYAILARDYEKLFAEIWRIPVTKYLLGGAAVAGLIPFARKYFDGVDVEAFFSSLRGKVRTKMAKRDLEETVSDMV